MLVTKLFTCVFYSLLISKSGAIKVFDTLLPNETYWGQSGLHYLKENQSVEFSESLTFCVRFRYRRFPSTSSLWHIKEKSLDLGLDFS